MLHLILTDKMLKVAALLFFAGAGRLCFADDIPAATVDVSRDGGLTWTTTFWSQPSTFGGFLPIPSENPAAMQAFLADDAFHFGCSNLTSLPNIPDGYLVLVVARGNCSFAQKAINAQNIGADAIVVYDSLPGKYLSASTNSPNSAQSILQAGACDVDCKRGSFLLPADKYSDLSQVYAGFPDSPCTSICGSGSLCLLAPVASGAAPSPGPSADRQVCCGTNDLLIMGASQADTAILTQLTIPMAYISASDGATLLSWMGYTPSMSTAGLWAPGPGLRRLSTVDVQGKPAVATAHTSAPRQGTSVVQALHSLHSTVFGLATQRRHGPSTHMQGVMMHGAEEYRLCAQAEGRVSGDPSLGRQLSSLSGPLSSNVFLRPSLRPVVWFDYASAVLWALGVLTTAFAAYVSVAEERARFKASVEGQDGDAAAAAVRIHGGPALSLSPRQAVYALSFAAVVLVTLYLMVHYGVPVVYIIMALFSLGACQAAALVYFFPLVDRFLPHWNVTMAVDMPWSRLALCLPCWPTLRSSVDRIEVTAAAAFAYGLGAVVVTVWLIERHAPGAFVLQDALGIALCCIFLSTLKVPNLRTATILLSLFFVYDIFMVFVTPYIFGSSVMIDVATAGMPTPTLNSACYCRLNPGDTSVCGPGEAMPILLRIPRFQDWRGGDTMLGLGDIVIPGLAISMAARRDWSTRGAAARASKGRVGYFPIAMMGYALGLALANVAVLFTSSGQPALLYLVPCVLGCIIGTSVSRREEDDMWYGTAPGLQLSATGEDGSGMNRTGLAGDRTPSPRRSVNEEYTASSGPQMDPELGVAQAQAGAGAPVAAVGAQVATGYTMAILPDRSSQSTSSIQQRGRGAVTSPDASRTSEGGSSQGQTQAGAGGQERAQGDDEGDEKQRLL